MSKTSTFLGGLLVGAAVGSALGILFAPKSGKETRDQLKGKLGEMEEELNKIRNFATGKKRDLKDDLKQKVADLENQMEQIIREYKDLVDSKP